MSGAKTERFTFLLNGAERTLEADGRTPLLDVLRNALGLKGTRFGCGNEECGACFVLVDGRSVASCNLPLWAIESKAVTTIEGLGRPEAPHSSLPQPKRVPLSPSALRSTSSSGVLPSASSARSVPLSRNVKRSGFAPLTGRPSL